MNQKRPLFLATLVLIMLSACSQHPQIAGPIASQVSVTQTGVRTSIAPDQTAAPAVTATITFTKSQILNRTFFYGVDLQYSSVYDASMDLYNQSLAQGHIPCFFRENGTELQLVADNRRLFPSDVNHPEQLISRYKITAETADTITVSEGDASNYISAMMDSKTNTPKDHWVRSFNFAADGNYILQETSIVLQDGTIAEVMESVFPTENLTASKSFQQFKLDPGTDSNAFDSTPASDPTARYRLLPGEAIFKGEDKMAFAQHFDINDAANNAAKTIDWYVTPNIKDEHVHVVREAVEGWNRYFRNFKGIARDVVLFKGRLPDGVKIGDPRYNVINWDSRLIAGAAYESQATDPFTGKQSHSLIYMPVAWFQIGMNYWTSGKYSDGIASENPKDFNKNKLFKATCVRDLTGAAQAIYSGRMSQADAETFSIQLMKQTLFHEVGHSLGLAHNFKGSLAFDRKDPKSIFSSSIMDYNDYEIERTAFDGIDSANGPELEYDRQALSAIYNNMTDVASDDKVVPTCNDAEADTQDQGAVDPLCIRYDIEKDPTLSVTTALNRITSEKLAGDVTLVEAFDNVTKSVFTADALAKVVTADDAIALEQQYIASLYGSLQFYFTSGKASLARVVKTNLKSLYVFEDGVLPDGYAEKDMRDRAYKGVQAVAGMKALPDLVKKKIQAIAIPATSLLLKTAFGATLSTSDATSLVAQLASKVMELGERFESDPNGLLKATESVLSSMARISSLPLFFGTISGSAMDFEKSITALLYEVSVDPARSSGERLYAAKSLVSYAGRLGADALLAKARAKTAAELALATTNDSRELDLLLNEVFNPTKQ